MQIIKKTMICFSRNYELKIVLVVLIIFNVVFGKLVITTDPSAREGDAEVLIPCDYSQFTDTPDTIDWYEVNKTGVIIDKNIVNNVKTVNGRYSLRTVTGNADLNISDPLRTDSDRRFQCNIRKKNGDSVTSSPSILTVYYLDDPILYGPMSIINEGQPVTLTCNISDGEPAPDITWYKDGKALKGKDVTTNSTMSVLHINQSSVDDKGNYTCHAESDQFKDNDGKSSGVYQLILNYIELMFELENDIATCTAEGHPKPINVTIIKDGEVIKNGEDRATVKIDGEICKSYLTCYADNGEFNKTEELKTCEVSADGESGFPVSVIIVIVFTCFLMLWCLVLCYFVHFKKIEWELGDDVEAAEGDPVTMTWRYRPSVARFKSFQLYKDDKECGSAQQQFSSSASFFKYILYCSVYLCGFVCCEYCAKERRSTSKPACTNERGMINMKIEKTTKSDSGTYRFKIECSRQQQSIEKVLHIQWLEMEFENYQAKEGYEFEMKCQYSLPDMPLKRYLWKKVDEDGNSLIDDLSKNPSFEVSKDEASSCTLTLRILKVKLSDAGMYQCSVGEKLLTAAHLNVRKGLKIECATYDAEEDFEFEMKCRYLTSDMPLTNYTWTKIDDGENPLRVDDLSMDPSNFEISIDKENCMLVAKILKVKVFDAGTYQCSVGEKCTATTYLRVNKAPFKMTIQGDVKSHGSMFARLVLNLTHVDESTKISNIFWYKKNVDKEHLLASLNDPDETGRYIIPKNTAEKNLTIKRIKTEDAGTYVCKISVEGKERMYSCYGQLEVEDIRMNDSIAEEGGTGSLVCVDKSNYKMKAVEWYKSTTTGIEPIITAEINEIKNNKKTKNRFTIGYSAGDFIMKIKNVTAEDSGKYICKLYTVEVITFSSFANLIVCSK